MVMDSASAESATPSTGDPASANVGPNRDAHAHSHGNPGSERDSNAFANAHSRA